MQNFLISFNVVFPIFVMMVLGMFLKKINLFTDTTVKQMNAVIFRAFLPVMIFNNVYVSEISQIFNPKLILFSIGCVVLCVATLFIVVPLLVRDNKKRGVLIQGSFRSNFVIFGIPISEALCGDAVSGVAAILIAVVVPVFNVLAVVSLEVFNGKKPDFKKIMKGIVTNPLIIGSSLGLLVKFFNITFPFVIEDTIDSISGIVTPLALIVLGASINLRAVGKNLVPLACSVFARLVLFPAIFLFFAAYVFGFRGPEFAILISLFASPAAVSSYTMAQQMGGDDELAAQIVMFGTTVSLFTMFMWIFVVMQLGLV